jgi:hypothetical protein
MPLDPTNSDKKDPQKLTSWHDLTLSLQQNRDLYGEEDVVNLSD